MFVQVETHGTSLFERVGGEAFFEALVERFYAGVEHDAVLRPLYRADLGPARRHLALFLAQYWGGPPTYNAERGHPRLRLRHVGFQIGRLERDAWLRHMRAAVETSGSSAADAEALMAYFETAATSLINQGRPPTAVSGSDS